MKTFEELYNEIVESDELKQLFAEATQTIEGAKEFLAKYDCSATLEEASAFLRERAQEAQEISEGDLDAVAGGSWAKYAWGAGSVLSVGTCFLFTAAGAAASAAAGDQPALDCVKELTGFDD